MEELSEIKKKIIMNEELARKLSLFLTKYSTPEQLSKELIVNHKRSKKQNKTINNIYMLAQKSEVGKSIIKSIEGIAIHSLIQNNKENLFCDSEGDLNIKNDYRLTCNFNGLLVKVRLKVNVPRANPSVRVENNFWNASVSSIRIPINWGRGFYKVNNVNANITVKLLSICDPNEEYITKEGRILGAKAYYESIKRQYNELAWYKRWYYLPPLEYKDWLKKQRKYKYPVNNSKLYKEIINSPSLQKDLLLDLNNQIDQVASNFNSIWNETLNYPSLVFGKSHLLYREDL